MERINSIEILIKKLKLNHNENSSWVVYPNIVGYVVKYELVENGIIIEGKLYPCSFINFTNYENKKEKGLAVIAFNNEVNKTLEIDNETVLENIVRIEFNKNPEKVIKESYIFSFNETSYMPTIPYWGSHKKIYSLLDSLNTLDRKVRITDWKVNGIVIKNNTVDILYLKEPLESISKITYIEREIGIKGNIVTIAHLSPISFNGLLVVKSVLKNNNMKVKVGDIVTVRVKRQGHHKGEIHSVIYPYKSKEGYITLNNCPYCNSILVKRGKEHNTYCINDLCDGVLIKRLTHWCSKDSMNIKGIGERIATYLVKNKIVSTIDDLYTLTLSDLSKVSGLLTKSAENILERINQSRTRSLKNVISSLGIENFNNRYTKLLAWELGDLETLLNLKNRKSVLLTHKQYKPICTYMSKESNKVLISNLVRQLKPTPSLIKTSSHPYVGKYFKLIGNFSIYSRDYIESLLKEANINVMDEQSDENSHWLHLKIKTGSIRKMKHKHVTLPKLLNVILD